MIPPCDPTILEKNPQFKKLQQHLTTNLLNANGTTRAEEADPARRAVVEELKELQVRFAKRDILKNAARRVALDSKGGLPRDLQDNYAIISLFLDSTSPTTVSSESAISLLERDIDTFLNNVHVLAAHVSQKAVSDVETLRSIADEATNPTVDKSRRKIRPSISRSAAQPRLSAQLTRRLDDLRELQICTLPALRRQMAVTAASVLAARAQVIERTVVLLERTKHGVLSRATKAQADHLATVAEGMNGKAQVMKLEALATIYTPETKTALEDYRKHLRDMHRQLEEKQNIAIQTLEEYERVGAQLDNDGQLISGPMADIARRYGSLTKEVETVKSDIRRLKG